jgi:hypothetical protein
MSRTYAQLFNQTTVEFTMASVAKFHALQKDGVAPIDALQVTVCASLGAALATFRSALFNHGLPFEKEHHDMLRAELERQFSLSVQMTDATTGNPITFN